MGVDVWGRNTRSGGGWNVPQDLALIESKGLSCALFAAGWIFEHECNGQINEVYFQKERQNGHAARRHHTLCGDPWCHRLFDV